MISRLREKYRADVVPALMKELGLTNRLSAPKVAKVVVNMGIGIVEKNVFEKRVNDLAAITGQKPIVTLAKKSISNFKLRAGMTIGAKATLRGDRMYEFLDRLIGAALPRIRDFRGLSPHSFDGRGSYSLGIREIEIFPEIDPNTSGGAHGLDITVVTTTTNDHAARRLLALIGMPFAGK
ncbi:MAG: 50S ribosomal protein L5 [Verrucomicrobiota bacterium]|nr:50S ribosomal protein L5 [Verrucomicrobiota bacterium]